ncbi:polyprenyl synthetase family protein [Vallitalea okinawensis]|uniref:polyprenyl synthetase family protein n=1 Tax=Vallitalea okinawensis TaxID=2078660 RepID=UPI000CFD7216|nr:farnesyl diphosphate synthase [Vallitalea okinawensis]
MLKTTLERKAIEISERLKAYIPNIKGYDEIIYEAMSYSYFAGGKRLRPLLMLTASQLFNCDEEEVYPFAAALEMIHTYSLIHDDLPAMDNDDYRRGKLTNHKVYGEDMAILAGDGLLNLAYETMSLACMKTEKREQIKAMHVIAESAGTRGMIGGQVVDILSEGKIISIDQLTYIHEKKTSKLIQAALVAGAVLAGASEKDICNMEEFGLKLGLAFQIQDDILDVTSTMEQLGKPIGSDEKNQKKTYVTMVGLEPAMEKVHSLTMEAIACLDGYPAERVQFLKDLAYYLIYRTN